MLPGSQNGERGPSLLAADHHRAETGRGAEAMGDQDDRAGPPRAEPLTRRQDNGNQRGSGGPGIAAAGPPLC